MRCPIMEKPGIKAGAALISLFNKHIRFERSGRVDKPRRKIYLMADEQRDSQYRGQTGYPGVLLSR